MTEPYKFDRQWNLGFIAGANANNVDWLRERIITETMNITVGTAKDFETLHEALKWLETVQTVGHGYVNLYLDDGIHILGGEGVFNQDEWAYYCLKNLQFSIRSTSGLKANCTITQDSWDDGDNWGALFALYSCHASVNNVTFDISLDGYPYANHTDVFWVFHGSKIGTDSADVKNAGFAYYTPMMAEINLYNSVIDNCEKGIVAYSSDHVLNQATISNCTQGIFVTTDRQRTAVTLKGCTLSLNTADANIPLNEIQYNGSFISNLASALSFKV